MRESEPRTARSSRTESARRHGAAMLASRRCSARPALVARARFKYSHLTDARKMLLRNTITAMTMGSGNRKSLSKSDINFVLDVETCIGRSTRHHRFPSHTLERVTADDRSVAFMSLLRLGG